MQTVINVRTSGPGLHEFTDEVVRFVRERDLREGLLTLFLQHTSSSLLVQENADPDVRRDLDEFFRRLVPSSDVPSMQWLRHTAEGPDDMPAHIKAALTAVSLSIPVMDGRPALGTLAGDLSVRAPPRCAGAAGDGAVGWMRVWWRDSRGAAHGEL
jgi:secondary thiamine-phosphate synthase enzyme